MPSFLQQFESALAGAADHALQNVNPSGGFAAFLQRSPAVAALFSIAIISAHTALSRIETQSSTAGAAPPRAVVPPPNAGT